MTFWQSSSPVHVETRPRGPELRRAGWTLKPWLREEQIVLISKVLITVFTLTIATNRVCVRIIQKYRIKLESDFFIEHSDPSIIK